MVPFARYPLSVFSPIPIGDQYQNSRWCNTMANEFLFDDPFVDLLFKKKHISIH